jgi:hypothetical protein
VQTFPLLAHHKGSDQSYRSAPLLLESLLQMLYFSVFAGQRSPLHLLKIVPFGRIVLLPKHILDGCLHPLLYPDPPMRNNLDSFPDEGELIDVQSVEQ